MTEFTIPDGFVMPSEEDWQRAAEVGLCEVRRALGGRLLRRVERGSPATLDLAVLFGALVSIGGAMRACCNPEEVERLAILYLRGAIRGVDGPVYEDGSPYPTSS